MDAKKAHMFADLFVTFIIAGIVTWYLIDAYTASSHIINLILVLPISLMVLALCIVEIIKQIKNKEEPTEKPEPVMTVIPVICLFTLYIASLAWLGFDVGTSLFIAAFLWLHGERRIIWILGLRYCVWFFGGAVFSAMLPYQMPMLILPG